ALQPIRMAADRLTDLIESGPIVLHHRKRNHQGAVDAIAIHIGEHFVRAIPASAMLRHAHMSVRVEYLHSVLHSRTSLAIWSPIATVLSAPPSSRVRFPGDAIAWQTAPRMNPAPCRVRGESNHSSIIATDRIVATGLAIP